MLEYDYEGLLVRSKSTYRPHCTSGTHMTIEMCMQPPALMLPGAWTRYKYTEQDIRLIYKQMDKTYAWQIALVLSNGMAGEEQAIDLSGKHIKIQGVSAFKLESIDHPLAWLLDTFECADSDSESGVLCTTTKSHTPSLPICPTGCEPDDITFVIEPFEDDDELQLATRTISVTPNTLTSLVNPIPRPSPVCGMILANDGLVLTDEAFLIRPSSKRRRIDT